MSYKKEKDNFREYKELPYTVVGHTSLLESFHIALKAEGLKKLIEGCHDEDMIHITVSGKEHKFEISRYVHV